MKVQIFSLQWLGLIFFALSLIFGAQLPVQAQSCRMKCLQGCASSPIQCNQKLYNLCMQKCTD